ncbi:type I restriction endonuclease [Endozoicomonas sp.]|uniref:type I restriction endonuclease n=1 Tax=Endozoicomonas sp. TaxID=1892382 RepID=UPI002883D66C|nr:type I restriction endonuclease [Endozoicomonas sp.]
MKFTEEQLEKAIIQLLGEQGYPYVPGSQIHRSSDDVLIKEDLRRYLAQRYQPEEITEGEIDTVIRQLETLPASDLYDSNKQFCQWLSDGFLLKREKQAKASAAEQKDLYIQLIDFPATDDVRTELRACRRVDVSDHQNPVSRLSSTLFDSAQGERRFNHDQNLYKLVNQMVIEGRETTRIPDAILYINGLPLVVFEFKSAIREDEASLHDAYVQLKIGVRSFFLNNYRRRLLFAI